MYTMKKIFSLAFIICLCVAAASVYAQGPMAATKTTLTNADTAYLTASPSKGNFVSLQLDLTKVSGTVAGTALVQCSENAVNWSTATDTAHATIAAYTITDGTQTKRWEIGTQKSRHYRIRVITSGTQSSTIRGDFWAW